MGDLFDGDESKKSKTTQKLPEFQRDRLKLLASESENALKQGDLSPDFFPGDTVPDFNQAERESQQRRLGSAEGLSQVVPEARESTNFALNLPQNIGDNPAVNDAISAAVQPITEEFQQDVLPSIRSGAVEAGQVGSSRQGVAEGLAADKVTENIGNVSSRLTGDFFNQALQSQAQARGQLPTLAQFSQAPANAVGQVGQEQRALSQAEINEEIARFDAEENERLRALSNFKNLVSGEFGGTTTTTQEGGGPGLGQVIGAGASIAGAVSSSKNYKKNGRPVETILPRIDRLKVEAWDYKEGFGDGETHIGPYAEDFKALFGVGDGKTIHPVDAVGILLLSVKELHEKVRRLEEDARS